jgi:hypothetical protein
MCLMAQDCDTPESGRGQPKSKTLARFPAVLCRFHIAYLWRQSPVVSHFFVAVP